MSAGEPERQAPQLRRNAPIPAPKVGDGVILAGVSEDGKYRLDLLNLKGEAVATVPLPANPSYHATLSRDGKRVAVWQVDPPRLGARPGQPGGPGSVQGTMRVFDVTNPDKPLATVGDHRSGGIVFAPDGNSVYFNTAPEPTANPVEQVTVYRFDLKTQKKEEVKVPAGHTLVDISPDGKTLLTNDYAKKNEAYNSTPYLVPLDTLKATPLSTACVRALRFSPDGTRVTGLKTPDPKLVWNRELIVLNVKDGKEAVVKLEKTHILWDTAWSPDGKKLLVNRLVLTGEAPPPQPVAPPPVAPGGGAVVQSPPTKPELTLCNPDGTEPKVLLDLKDNANIFGVAWR
jgi:dipeptidyl aminopeptidase/acylaminoacyl peptidase